MEWLALRSVRTSALVLAVAVVTILTLLVSATRLGLPSHFLPASQQSQLCSPASCVSDSVDWRNFAYIQYVTNGNYLCNSLMMLEALYRLGAKADRLLMYPSSWDVPSAYTGSSMDLRNLPETAQFLIRARDQYKAKLVPIEVQTSSRGDPTWKDSFTKLLAFNQTQYRRVLSLDSDATLRENIDELFLLPSAPVAMPRAYWLDQLFLSSQIALIEPSYFEWKRVQEVMSHDNAGFDMDILNIIYKDSCLVIPHRQYTLLSVEFRNTNHSRFLGSEEEKWDGSKALNDAKFVHFSDWPFPKPWFRAPDEIKANYEPICGEELAGQEPDCTDRDIWRGLYADFRQRRQVS